MRASVTAMQQPAAASAEAGADAGAAQVAVLEVVLRTLAVREQSLDFHVR